MVVQRSAFFKACRQGQAWGQPWTHVGTRWVLREMEQCHFSQVCQLCSLFFHYLLNIEHHLFSIRLLFAVCQLFGQLANYSIGLLFPCMASLWFPRMQNMRHVLSLTTHCFFNRFVCSLMCLWACRSQSACLLQFAGLCRKSTPGVWSICLECFVICLLLLAWCVQSACLRRSAALRKNIPLRFWGACTSCVVPLCVVVCARGVPFPTMCVRFHSEVVILLDKGR
jgi:hypothetical protein